MPKTRTDIQKELDAKARSSHRFRLNRLPQLIAEASGELQSREDKKKIMGVSYDTLLKRIEDPAQLTLGECARLYKYSAGSDKLDEDEVAEYIRTFIIESAKDID